MANNLSIKRICIVSPEEDFRLKLALLLSDTCLVELCSDWDSLFDVVSMHETFIAVIDSTLLKDCTSTRRRALTDLAKDRRIYVVGVYPYQLDTELVEDTIQHQVDLIWMQKILHKNPPHEHSNLAAPQ